MSQSQITADEQRRRVALALQVAGLGDIVIGVAAALLGPTYIGGGDPFLETALRIIGAVLVLAGLGLWWWGRKRGGARLEQSGPVTRRRR